MFLRIIGIVELKREGEREREREREREKRLAEEVEAGHEGNKSVSKHQVTKTNTATMSGYRTQ